MRMSENMVEKEGNEQLAENAKRVSLPLPKSFKNTKPAPIAVFQGAEAHLYRTHFLSADNNLSGGSDATDLLSLSAPAALKYRPPKKYRHPSLDAKITRHRILAEARVLARLRREDVSVPTIYALDWEEGWILTQWIEGRTVREVLDTHMPSLIVSIGENGGDGVKAGLLRLMQRVGNAVGKLHEAGVIHGDLTTSNLLLQHDEKADVQSDGVSLDGRVFVIDFGLASQSIQDEDRGVDLYVLERAFGTTHPQTEELWKALLNSYGQAYKGARSAQKRLDEVRMRGRKKIMIG